MWAKSHTNLDFVRSVAASHYSRSRHQGKLQKSDNNSAIKRESVVEGDRKMTKLMFLIYVIAAPTLAGIAMVIALVTGWNTGSPVIISVIAGALAAFPVSWMVAKKLNEVKGLTN